ncbi:unnamed protein product [Moneuplotes crassus]|uniref:Uncharacterized protein n=1 Tax=Euplotes crassus TaxID=5936 RepID=A0AAD1UK08_EUPCR|nr:unnamed protein product [Moneuplotes crassus]
MMCYFQEYRFYNFIYERAISKHSEVSNSVKSAQCGQVYRHRRTYHWKRRRSCSCVALRFLSRQCTRAKSLCLNAYSHNNFYPHYFDCYWSMHYSLSCRP